MIRSQKRIRIVFPNRFSFGMGLRNHLMSAQKKGGTWGTQLARDSDAGERGTDAQIGPHQQPMAF
jgi:hypothetical protein